MKKTFFYITFLFLCSFILPQGVFGVTGEIHQKPETLREMSEKIGDLKQEKELLDFKWKTFRIGNKNLGDLIKTDLSEEEKEEIENIILDYSEDKENLEEDIEEALESGDEVDSIHRKLLLLKQDFYKSLLSYLQESKLEGFKKYVESDLSLREKSNEVASQIEQKNVEREERIDELQEKIKFHKEKLHEQIRLKAAERTKEKLDAFVNEEKFQALENSSKIKIFRRIIDKIQTQRDAYEQNDYKGRMTEEKKILYEVVEEIIQTYIGNWQ